VGHHFNFPLIGKGKGIHLIKNLKENESCSQQAHYF